MAKCVYVCAVGVRFVFKSVDGSSRDADPAGLAHQRVSTIGTIGTLPVVVVDPIFRRCSTQRSGFLQPCCQFLARMHVIFTTGQVRQYYSQSRSEISLGLLLAALKLLLRELAPHVS